MDRKKICQDISPKVKCEIEKSECFYGIVIPTLGEGFLKTYSLLF